MSCLHAKPFNIQIKFGGTRDTTVTMGNKASSKINDGRGAEYQASKPNLANPLEGKDYHSKSPDEVADSFGTSLGEGLDAKTVQTRLRVRPPFLGDPKLRARYKDFGLLATAEVKRIDEEWAQIDAHDLVPGDLVRVKAGDVVPQDIRIVRCSEDCAVDQSALTGDPEPEKRVVASTHITNGIEALCMLYASTNMVRGTAEGIVTSTGIDTVMGQLAQLMANDKPPKAASKGRQAAQELSKQGVFLKMPTKHVLSALGTAKWICLDKTGVMTDSNYAVSAFTLGHQILDKSAFEKIPNAATETSPAVVDVAIGKGLKAVGAATGGHAQLYDTFCRLVRCMALTTTAQFRAQDIASGKPFQNEKTLAGGTTVCTTNWNVIGDPTDSAFLQFAESQQADRCYAHLQQVPASPAVEKVCTCIELYFKL